MAQSMYLRNKRTGVIFIATEQLRKLDDMEECNADGSPFVPFIDDVSVVDDTPMAVDSDPALKIGL